MPCVFETFLDKMVKIQLRLIVLWTFEAGIEFVTDEEQAQGNQ